MLLDPEINANALTWAQDSNKTRTKTIDDGKGASLVHRVELAGGLSKLAPALARMVASHRAIRRRTCPPGPPRRNLLQLSRPDEAALQEAETAYL